MLWYVPGYLPQVASYLFTVPETFASISPTNLFLDPPSFQTRNSLVATLGRLLGRLIYCHFRLLLFTFSNL